jgi:hypothetical protein
MPEKTLPKETNHGCDICKFFGIFFLGMKHALEQTWLELLTSLAKNWKCEALGCTKIVENVPPFYFTCTQASVNPHNNPSKCKALWLSTFDHLICCYTYPCALVQALMLKEQGFCSNGYK